MLLTLLLAACPTPEPEPVPETGQSPELIDEMLQRDDALPSE